MFYVSTYSTDPKDNLGIYPGPFIASRTLKAAMEFATALWTLPGGKAVVYRRGSDGMPDVVWRAE